jgi:uncharacterized protein YecT (DUF1311 family)
MEMSPTQFLVAVIISLSVTAQSGFADFDKSNVIQARIQFDELHLSRENPSPISGSVSASLTSGAATEVDNILGQASKLSVTASAEVMFKAADNDLNDIYVKLTKNPDFESEHGGLYSVEGIRVTQRSWIRYRDALAKFGDLKDLTPTGKTLMVLSTQQRAGQLRAILSTYPLEPMVYRCPDTKYEVVPTGDLAKATAPSPNIVYWSRTYRAKGKSTHIKMRAVGSDLEALATGGQIPKVRRYWRTDDITQEWGTKSFWPNEEWKIRLETINDAGGNSVCWSSSRITVRTGGHPKYFYLPDLGMTSWSELEFFDEDLQDIYFSLTNGDSTIRNQPLFYLHLQDGSFHLVGVAAGFAVSKDRRWIVWGSGEKYGKIGDKTVEVQSLYYFDVQKKKNYKLSRGVCEDLFERFEGIDGDLMTDLETVRNKRLKGLEKK